MRKNKLLDPLLAAAMLFSLLPSAAFAKEDTRTKIMAVDAEVSRLGIEFGGTVALPRHLKSGRALRLIFQSICAAGIGGTKQTEYGNPTAEKALTKANTSSHVWLRVYGESGKTHVLGKGCTVTVNGVEWGKSSPDSL